MFDCACCTLLFFNSNGFAVSFWPLTDASLPDLVSAAYIVEPKPKRNTAVVRILSFFINILSE